MISDAVSLHRAFVDSQKHGLKWPQPIDARLTQAATINKQVSGKQQLPFLIEPDGESP